MERNLIITEDQKQIQILTFMEVTECQDYQQAKTYAEKNNFNLKDAIAQYMAKIRKTQSLKQTSTQSTYNHVSPQRFISQNNTENLMEFSLTPQEAMFFQQRLRTTSQMLRKSNDLRIPSSAQSERNKKNCISNLCNNLKNSFNCLKRLKSKLQKKYNSMKKGDDRIFYFQEIYQAEILQSFLSMEDNLVESFQLKNVEQNYKIKVWQNSVIKPIFALVTSNRKNPLISEFVRNRPIMNFLRQHFEIVFLTLSQLKQVQLDRRHCLRNISKCPTALIYLKNFYDLQDVLLKIEGEQIKQLNVQQISQSLKQVPNLVTKCQHLIKLQKQLRDRQITSLNQVANYFEDQQEEPYYQRQQNSSTISNYTDYGEFQTTKKSLIQEQTKIYEEMAAQENKRKKSLQLQKQKIEELKELRQVRKLSIPDEPSDQNFHLSMQFRFRCPLNGEYITRRFLKDQKLDILYQFVDTNDKIEFQNESERSFELFTSFPPTPLCERKDKYLKDVFDQEKENILIREI